MSTTAAGTAVLFSAAEDALRRNIIPVEGTPTGTAAQAWTASVEFLCSALHKASCMTPLYAVGQAVPACTHDDSKLLLRRFGAS